MMRMEFSQGYLIGIAGLLAWTSLLIAPAVQGSEAGAKAIEEVVVTARRREEAAQDVPIPITALNQEQLTARNITEIKDIEKMSPNTSLQYSSVNGSATEVFIRGIGQTNWSSTQDPKIGIYVDGVYLSRPQGGLLDLMDVAQVEILRGPQGTLFGRNTTAGLIQIITNKPSFENEAEIRLGFGNEGHQHYSGMVNRVLSDNLTSRFSILGKETDGFITNSVTGNDRGNEDSLSYRASLLGAFDSLTARFTYDHFEANERATLGTCRFNGPENGMTAGGLSAVANIFGIYDEMRSNCLSTTRDESLDNTNDERTTSDVDAYTLEIDYDMGWADVISITSYREIDNLNGSWGWVMGAGSGVNFLEILNNESENKIFSQEVRLTGSTDTLDWVIGAYVFEENSDESLDVPLFRNVSAPSLTEWPLFYAPTGATNPDGSAQTFGDVALANQVFGSRSQAYDVTNENRAFFAELTYEVTDRIDLTVGARYTKDDRAFTRIQTLFGGAFDPGYFCPGMPTVEIAPGTVISASDRCHQEVSYSKTTPRVILSYDLNDSTLLYGSYSVGYSSGGFNQDVRMRPFLPEVSDNIELGMKSDLFGNRMRLNATVFYNDYENQQVTVGRIVNGQPTADLINAKEAAIAGVEVDVLAQLTDSLSLSMSAGYLAGDYKQFTIDDNVTDPITLEESIVVRDLSGVEFGSDGSEKSFDISLLHTYSMGNRGDLTSSLGYSFQDDQYYTLMNTPSSFEPSYWLLDGRITWNLANGETRVSLWGTNLTDEEYVDTMIDQSGDIAVGGIDPSLGMTAVYWGSPRRVGLDITHAF